jgi:hypothetical protein
LLLQLAYPRSAHAAKHNNPLAEPVHELPQVIDREKRTDITALGQGREDRRHKYIPGRTLQHADRACSIMTGNRYQFR